MRLTAILIICQLTLLSPLLHAQTVKDLIAEKPAYASCNYNTYPDSIPDNLTPSPSGKRPFYLSHYGRHGSRYISNRSGYDIPYRMMQHADSVDELTQTGRRVLQEIQTIMDDTEDRWGELTSYGKEQHRKIGRRMAERFPEIFCPGARVKAVSTVVPRCIESMGTAITEMLQVEPTLQVSMEASKRTMHYMNHQDRNFQKNYMTPEA